MYSKGSRTKIQKKLLIIREVLRPIILFVSPLNRIYHIVIGQYLMLHFECKEENVGEVYGYRI